MIKIEPLPSNFRSVQIRQVIQVTTYEGKGIPENVGREVETFCDMEGNVIFVKDPQPPEKESEPTSTTTASSSLGEG